MNETTLDPKTMSWDDIKQVLADTSLKMQENERLIKELRENGKEIDRRMEESDRKLKDRIDKLTTRFTSQSGHILEGLMNTLYAQENVYVELADDYRSAVIAADYIILDRSAVMVEAGACGVPVLYMHNSTYDEKMTEAIQPLVESYYQGTTAGDMIQFVEMCKSGEDPLFKLRENAFKKCVPMFDGMAGERICNEIAEALLKEDIHSSI